MTQETALGKEALWLACREKNCCYTALVLTSGRDVWRISKTLQTPPWTYLMYFQSPPRPDAFVLDGSGRYFRMALSKGKTRRTKSPPPCIFLTRTRAGHHRCGLGDLRPQVCRAYPSETVSGVLCVRNDGGCTCRIWALADVDITEESKRVQARYDEFKEYCDVVAYWNNLVTSAPDEMNVDFYDFCNFLMEAYDEMESGVGAGTGETGEAR